MRTYGVVGFFCLSILFATLLTAQSVHANYAWSIQTLDKNTDGSGFIALDSKGNPRILYGSYENGNYHNPEDLVFASWTGSTWNQQTVTKNVFVLDFKLDASGSPHMIYRTDTMDIRYASWTQGSALTSFPLADTVGTPNSLALDSSGNPHVACTANGHTVPLVLNYAVWTGSEWNTQTVDKPSQTIDDRVYLALDSEGNPHILYGYDIHQNDTTAIKYATLTGSGWSIQTVMTNIPFQAYGNMVLDSNGFPHFTYWTAEPTNKPINGILNYASWNGTAWSMQIVASNVDFGLGSAYLALDSHNNPHIDYLDETPDSSTGKLIYTEWTGTTWSSQTIDSSAYYPGPIVIDSNGKPHVTYGGEPAPLADHTIPLMYAATSGLAPTASPTPPPNVGLTLLLPIVIAVIAVLTTLIYILKRKQRKGKS